MMIRLALFNFQLSTFNFQLSTFNFQLLTFNSAHRAAYPQVTEGDANNNL